VETSIMSVATAVQTEAAAPAVLPDPLEDGSTTEEIWPLRLRLSSDIGRGALDGGWWPYSRDLAAEALDLVDHFPVWFDRVCRILQLPPVPPEWDAHAARHALWLAASPSNTLSGTAILHDSQDSSQADPLSRWTDDGGTSDRGRNTGSLPS
jgi:hypothetical protein